MLLSVVFGALGEAYLPGKIIVGGDAGATAANILQHPTLFRMTFAAYLVEGICDVLLAVVFYILLEPIDRNLALISAFFGVVAMLTYAIAESSFFTASLVVRETNGMAAFTAEQRGALALLATRVSRTTAELFLITYGIGVMIRGYLLARSNYVPKAIAVLFMIGGAGFILKTVTYLLAPSLSSPILLMPMAVGALPLMLWLLVKGVAAPTGERVGEFRQPVT
jgi:hypothetical protein